VTPDLDFKVAVFFDMKYVKNGAVSEQCFTSPPTQYRLYGRQILQVKRPNQQYQSTEGDATKEKENNENN